MLSNDLAFTQAFYAVLTAKRDTLKAQVTPISAEIPTAEAAPAASAGGESEAEPQELTLGDCTCGHPDYEHDGDTGACWLCPCAHLASGERQ